MRLLIDLHLHTNGSRDSYITLEDAARRCREQGLDGFAVTNHDSLAEIPPSFLDKVDLIVIPGIEISASGAHIVAFDIRETVEEKLSIGETVERIHDQGGLATISHPYSFFRSWVNLKEVERAGFDLVEVANAYQYPYDMMREKNGELAERLGLPQTGGSDAHVPSTVGRAYTIMEAEERSLEGVLGALREGKTNCEGRGISLTERLKWIGFFRR